MSLTTSAANKNANNSEPSISPWTSQHLNQANEYLAAENYSQALIKLNSLLDSVKDDAYEAAITQQAIGYTYALQDNYPQAIEHFENALPGLSPSYKQTQKTRYDLAQLYVAEEQYAKAATILKTWIQQAKKPNAKAHILLANALTQLEQTDQAIFHAKQAIALQKEPVENWYRLLLALYLEKERYQDCVDLLPKMIALFPNTAIYWKQLGSIHLQLRNFKAGTAALEIAWKKGLLTQESEIVRLANLLNHNQMPAKAAQLLETAINQQKVKSNQQNWQLTAQSWLAAREITKAITAFENAAAIANNGDIYEQIAQLYVDQRQWQNAKAALTKGFKKGNLKNTGNCYLLLGIIETELNNPDQAKQAFEKAIQFKQSAKPAQQWLSLVNTKFNSQ